MIFLVKLTRSKRSYNFSFAWVKSFNKYLLFRPHIMEIIIFFIVFVRLKKVSFIVKTYITVTHLSFLCYPSSHLLIFLREFIETFLS